MSLSPWISGVPWLQKKLSLRVVLNYHESARCYQQEVRVISSIIGLEHLGDVDWADPWLTRGAPSLNRNQTRYDFLEFSPIVKAVEQNKSDVTDDISSV